MLSRLLLLLTLFIALSQAGTHDLGPAAAGTDPYTEASQVTPEPDSSGDTPLFMGAAAVLHPPSTCVTIQALPGRTLSGQPRTYSHQPQAPPLS